MKEIKRILRILVVACCATLLGAFAACSDSSADFTITLQDAAFRPDLFIGEEYTIDDVVEKEEGASYSIAELFYFDDDFVKQDIPHANGKFTQEQPYDVILEIAGEKDGDKDSVVVELKINYTSVPVLDAIMTSWNDEGVIKSYSARAEHLQGNAPTALVVRYMGSLTGMDGASFGNFTKAMGSCSVTDWSNAVVTMDAYNAENYDIALGWQISKDQVDYQIDLTKTIIPAKSWVKVAWSLRAEGYAEDYFSSGKTGAMGLKATPVDTSVGGPFDYTFVLCNVDVTDYSAERFPDLETRTIAEINRDKYDALEGDALDKAMVAFATYTPNYDATTDTTVKKVGDSSVKYTFTCDPTMTYPTKARGNLFEGDGKEFAEYFTELTEWEDVRVGFWVKTAIHVNLAVRFQNTKDGVAYRGSEDMSFGGYVAHKDVWESADWQYVEFNLSALFKNLYTADVTGYKLVICNEVSLNDGESAEFYIDGLNLWSVHVPKLEGDEDDKALYKAGALQHSKYGTSTSAYSTAKYEGSSLEKPTELTSTYYVKADVTYSGNDLVSVPVYFDAMPSGYLSGTDYSNAYVGVWVYNATGATMTARLMVGDQCDQYPNAYETTVTSVAAGAWTYVEFSLAKVGTSKFGIVLWTWQETVAKDATATYYMDGFSIYTK